MKHTLLLTPILAALLGCNVADPSGGTDTGNGLALGLTAARIAADAQGTTFEVEAAKASVKDIQLFLPGEIDCGAIEPHEQATCNDAQYVISGPFEVDLITRETTPAIEAPVPTGTYRRVDVRFERSTSLGDRTIVGSGTFDDEGTPTGFDFALAFNDTARFENTDGVVVDPDTTLLALLDVTSWLSAAPITDCFRAGDLEVNDGRLQLADGRGQCRALENEIALAVKSSGRLER
jgi:hypothetical protein